MTIQSMKSFLFEGGKTLSAFEKEGQTWFVANDVCRIIGIRNTRQAVASLDTALVGMCVAQTGGGPQTVLTLSEMGLYSLLLKSRKPDAKRFRAWMARAVLPVFTSCMLPSSVGESSGVLR